MLVMASMMPRAPGRVDPGMTNEQRIEEDRVVGRRVDRGTTASEADERAYAAADPLPTDGPAEGYRGPAAGPTDTDPGGPGGTTERAARETAQEGQEPTRSE
jgi:hypothetical protein